MNSVAAAGNLPVVALRSSGIEQSWIPDEWHGDDAAVTQAHAECAVGKLYVQHALIRARCRRCRKTHSMPPEAADANPSPSIVSNHALRIWNAPHRTSRITRIIPGRSVAVLRLSCLSAVTVVL